MAGEEILNYYGPHPNSELLRRYGYVTEKHSRYDVVEIPWSVVEGAVTSRLQLSPVTIEKAVSGHDAHPCVAKMLIQQSGNESARMSWKIPLS